MNHELNDPQDSGQDFPKFLYKYRSLSGSGIDHALDTIRESRIYFAAPTSFNDPFDCRPPYSFESTTREKEAYFKRIGRRHLKNLGRSERRHFTKERRKAFENDPSVRQFVMSQHTETVTQKIGVYCLSTKYDDILMWSHYSNGHSGLCFRFNATVPFFAAALPVIYSNDRPHINPFRQSKDQMLEAAMLTKAKHWSYEQEWRIVEYKGGSGIYQFPPEALEGVILGCRITKENSDRIKAAVDQDSRDIKLYHAAPNERRFAIGIE